MARLVLGMGTGRCGTMSLARLLGLQHDTESTHEFPPTPTWSTNHDEAMSRVAGIAARLSLVAADVAWHYLCHLLVILDNYPDTKFICLERDRTGYLISAYRKILANVNPFQDHDGRDWISFPEFECGVPKFNRCSRDKTLQRYYDFYILKSYRLAERFSDNVRIWPMDVLNNTVLQAEMLTWAGFDKPVIELNIKENVATTIVYEYKEMV